jgi:uncharacterized protein
VEQRVSLITLGVDDLKRARAFYEALGWQSSCAPDSDVVFFQAGGMVFGLWGREQLAEDSGLRMGSGFGGVTLAYNVSSPTEVDEIIDQARRAGASVSRDPGETFWGGYTGVFVDPEGYPWEVAHNPGWTLGADGTVTL